MGWPAKLESCQGQRCPPSAAAELPHHSLACQLSHGLISPAHMYSSGLQQVRIKLSVTLNWIGRARDRHSMDSPAYAHLHRTLPVQSRKEALALPKANTYAPAPMR